MENTLCPKLIVPPDTFTTTTIPAGKYPIYFAVQKYISHPVNYFAIQKLEFVPFLLVLET